jgi:hypothetical protein
MLRLLNAYNLTSSKDRAAKNPHFKNHTSNVTANRTMPGRTLDTATKVIATIGERGNSEKMPALTNGNFDVIAVSWAVPSQTSLSNGMMPYTEGRSTLTSLYLKLT